jgi:hypothetical protein
MYTFAILDGARMLTELDQAKKLNPDHVSLYEGMSLNALETIAPHLFFIESENEFSRWYMENGWGKSWGIFIETRAKGEELFNHLQKFIIVFTDNGRKFYFRYYDPRALRIFLPTCDTQQLSEFFGPIESFIMEDKNPEFACVFKFINNQLFTEKILKTDLFVNDKIETRELVIGDQ